MPSLKNAKTISFNKKTGKRFVRTEQRVADFMNDAKDQVKAQWQEPVLEKIDNLTCIFYNQDKRKHDTSNQLDTVCDIIKGIIVKDDDQFSIGSSQIQYGGIDKDNPRTEIWIDL